MLKKRKRRGGEFLHVVLSLDAMVFVGYRVHFVVSTLKNLYHMVLIRMALLLYRYCVVAKCTVVGKGSICISVLAQMYVECSCVAIERLTIRKKLHDFT